MKSRKIVPMNLYVGRQWRHRHREQTCGHGGDRGDGRCRTNGESNMETYTLSYVK